MISDYLSHAAQREEMGIPPLPLTEQQTAILTGLLEEEGPHTGFLLELLANRVEPGVSPAARIKADWLGKVARGKKNCSGLSPRQATRMLGTMGGGYNVRELLALLKSEQPLAAAAAMALKNLTKVYEAFAEIAALAPGSPVAAEVLESWASAEWLLAAPQLPAQLTLTVYKVDGEINTDDFSPGNQAQSRADIPLHATFFGAKRFPDGIQTIAGFCAEGHQVAFAGDVVGTGSSRKSAINSLAWHIGRDIEATPNKRRGGIVLGSTIAPIFYATARDAGLLPIQCDVSRITTGEVVLLDLEQWTITLSSGDTITLDRGPASLLDEYRAGGRLNLIIGRDLTDKSCRLLGREIPSFREETMPPPGPDQPYTLAQKMVGRACGLDGVLPGTICQPRVATVGSQDTTGPMTVQELEELACLTFKTDLYLQSFCHTAAYPKKSDLGRWRVMTDAATSRGGVALNPGDGVIHPWLNRMLLPDTVGTGGDSHTRFPLGISFPAGSGLVAFGAALGFIPLEMPASVLVRFIGRRRPGITVRDMVNAIAWQAIDQGLLTVEKKNKKNVFAGRILEIQGVDDLRVEEAFELSDASAERNAAACTLALPEAAVIPYIQESIALLESMIADGYRDAESLARRVAAMRKWLAAPSLLRADDQARYHAELEIDLDRLIEPLLACPNDPDDIRPLSAVAGESVDEVFIGSCMTHLSHLQQVSRLFATAGYARSRLWIAPSTRMDKQAITAEGGMSVFGSVGARVEIPGCSLCMGNQARVQPGATVVSTSTRNFDNRLGDGTRVYLASSEVAAISAVLGRIPSPEEYFDRMIQIGMHYSSA
jgi:aconitate hydratase 2 / 2-methylisocitrate dehydratase